MTSVLVLYGSLLLEESAFVYSTGASSILTSRTANTILQWPLLTFRVPRKLQLLRVVRMGISI